MLITKCHNIQSQNNQHLVNSWKYSAV